MFPPKNLAREGLTLTVRMSLTHYVGGNNNI